MMTNVMALAFYAQSAEDYWYPFGKLRGTTLSGSNPSLEMQQTGQKISVSALKASTLSIYQSMVSLYNDFLNDNPKSLEPQGI